MVRCMFYRRVEFAGFCATFSIERELPEAPAMGDFVVLPYGHADSINYGVGRRYWLPQANAVALHNDTPHGPRERRDQVEIDKICSDLVAAGWREVK